MMWGARSPRLACIGVLFVITAGCVSLPRDEQKPVHTFLLTQETAISESGFNGVKPPGGVMVIGVPQAQPGFDSPRMAYTQRPFEVQYYATNQWAETPPRMLMPLLIQTMERHVVARAVVPLPSSVRGDYRLDVDQVLLVQEFAMPPSRARVGFRAQLLKLPDHAVLGSRSFEAIESAISEDAYGGAVAANRALNKLMDELGSWVGRCIKTAVACER